MSRSIVTGGFGFIASELTRQLLERGDTVAVLDPLTYAANPHSLADCEGRFEHFVCGVEDESAQDVVTHFRPDTIYHAAAESHVDRSIASYRGFVDTNITGTFNLLEGCRKLPEKPLFVYISTDEVYGSLPEGRASEGAKLNPCNPYSVSKAAAEHTVRAAQHTWQLPFIITRSCNNYGPSQHPEKLLPATITAFLKGEAVKLHGDGRPSREWIYVADNVRAIITAAEKGVPNETYNITTSLALTNRQLVEMVANMMGVIPKIELVPDRPGNDLRYAMTSAKLALLGWRPEESFESGLRKTVEWYEKSKMWWSSKSTLPSKPADSR